MREWVGVLRTNKRLRRKEGSWEAMKLGGTIIYLTKSFYLIIPEEKKFWQCGESGRLEITDMENEDAIEH